MNTKTQDQKDGIGTWRLGVPVATPVSAADCIAGLMACFAPQLSIAEFEGDLRRLLNACFIRCTNSGRSALYFILRAMRETSRRNEVVVPGFVCPSVGRAVIKAGLKLVLCDVAPGGSGFDLASLQQVLNSHTLAVVPAHLYGYAFDVSPVVELSHAAGAMVIEDAAQAFGAKFNGQYVGTSADAGVFSFGISKVLGGMGGGLVVTSNLELGRRVDCFLSANTSTVRLREVRDVASLGAFSILVRSHHLVPLDAIWSRFLRGKNDCRDFDASTCAPSQAIIARRLLSRLSSISAVRKYNAMYFAERLANFNQLSLPKVHPRSEPEFLRFPIIVKDPSVKGMLISCLRARGVNVSEMYTLESYNAMRGWAARTPECPQAEYLSERMLNLPTHAYMRAVDLDAAVGAFHFLFRGTKSDLDRNVVMVPAD